MDSWCKNFELLIKSKASIIWIKTKEEERLEKLINFSCGRLNIKKYVQWDFVSGIKGSLNEDISTFNSDVSISSELAPVNIKLMSVTLLTSQLFKG